MDNSSYLSIFDRAGEERKKRSWEAFIKDMHNGEPIEGEGEIRNNLTHPSKGPLRFVLE
jgi:hypothetical protein